MGNLEGLMNAQGQPVTIYNPATNLPYLNNQVPVSAQAAALLALYPLPNPNISSASGYNYQAPVLNSVHQDGMQSRLDKTIGTQGSALRRIQLPEHARRYREPVQLC